MKKLLPFEVKTLEYAIRMDRLRSINEWGWFTYFPE